MEKNLPLIINIVWECIEMHKIMTVPLISLISNKIMTVPLISKIMTVPLISPYFPLISP